MKELDSVIIGLLFRQKRMPNLETLWHWVSKLIRKNLNFLKKLLSPNTRDTRIKSKITRIPLREKGYTRQSIEQLTIFCLFHLYFIFMSAASYRAIRLWLRCSCTLAGSLVEVLTGFHKKQLFPIQPLAEEKRVHWDCRHGVWCQLYLWTPSLVHAYCRKSRNC